MILYFANRKMQILGQATTNLPKGFVVVDDMKTEEVETGVAVFTCTIGFDNTNRKHLEEMTETGNYLLRSNGVENEFYTIIDVEIDTKDQSIYVYAEDAGLDLLNEIAPAFEADGSYNLQYYVDKYTKDSGFEMGINEVPSASVRKLSWEGESTVTERLASIVTQFGGYEVSYSFAVKNLAVTNKYINFHKQRGKEVGEKLRLNKEIDRILTKKSIANLATALRCTGGTPENSETPITLRGYTYDDGDFYVNSSGVLCSRKALSKWSRYVWNKEPGLIGGNYEGHICRLYSYDTLNQATLCSHAVSELKKYCEPEVNYEIELKTLPEGVKIGDRVDVIDDAGELYLSSRILKLETSITQNIKTAIFGEYLIKDDGISAKVEELANQFSNVQKAKTHYTWTAYADDENGGGISLDPTNKAYLGTAVNRLTEAVDISDPSVFSWVKVYGEDSAVLRIESSRGTVFKNNQVSTVLSVVVYKGSKRITDISELKKEFGSSAYIEWCWQKMDEETFGTILSTDSRIGNEGFTLSLTPADVNTKAVFMCQLITD